MSSLASLLLLPGPAAADAAVDLQSGWLTTLLSEWIVLLHCLWTASVHTQIST